MSSVVKFTTYIIYIGAIKDWGKFQYVNRLYTDITTVLIFALAITLE